MEFLYFIVNIAHYTQSLHFNFVGKFKDYKKSMVAFFGLICISSSLLGYTIYPNAIG